MQFYTCIFVSAYRGAPSRTERRKWNRNCFIARQVSFCNLIRTKGISWRLIIFLPRLLHISETITKRLIDQSCRQDQLGPRIATSFTIVARLFLESGRSSCQSSDLLASSHRSSHSLYKSTAVDSGGVGLFADPAFFAFLLERSTSQLRIL